MRRERCAITTRAAPSFLRVGHIELHSRRATGQVRCEDQDVARYAACARVINLAIVGLVSVNLLIAPKLPVLYQQGKHAEMQALLRRNNVVVALVSLLPALALLFSVAGSWPRSGRSMARHPMCCTSC